MNDRQNAKLNMAQRVSETFKRYENAYKGVTPIVDAVAQLNTDITDIRDVQKEKTAVSITSASLEKRAAEANMIERAVKIANALYVIGFKNENKELITLLGVNDRSFYRCTNNAALALAKFILDLTHQNATELANFTIDAAEIVKFEDAIEKYNTVIAKPMDTIGAKKQKTTNLAQLFAGLDSTLYDRLDKLMVLFKQSNIEFYQEYRTARNIIFQHENKRPPKPEEVINIPAKNIETM